MDVIHPILIFLGPSSFLAYMYECIRLLYLMVHMGVSTCGMLC